MAVTADQVVSGIKDYGTPSFGSFPMANTQNLYKGALGCIVKEGYLENLTTSNYYESRLVVVPAVESDAATANGSISGTLETGSNLVRCYTGGILIKMTFTSIAQDDLGKTVYATDNFTLDDSALAGVPVGFLHTYLSATSGWVALNQFSQADGYILARGSLTAATTTTGGDALGWLNPTNTTIMVKNVILDVTTQATGAATMNVGIAADTTTTSSTLIDGGDVGTAAIVLSAQNDGGTLGQSFRKATSTQAVTATPSATLAGLVGTYEIEYRIWE
jgi:hypothetical protein